MKTAFACYSAIQKIVFKKQLLPFLLFILFSFTLHAQVINEGFEEPIWTSFATGAGGSTSGQAIITAPTAGSIMTYLSVQGASNTSTATNTCPNSGTWWYSKMCTQSSNSTKLGSGCHSVTHSVKIGTSGYIATPITPAAVVSITFWAATTGTIIAGLATNTNAAQPIYNSNTTSDVGPFSYASTTYPGAANNTFTSYSFTGTFSGPCRFALFNISGGSIDIDDIMIYLPTGTPPTVVTNSATPAITSAQVSATVTPGTLPLLMDGIIWTTSPTGLTGTVSDTLLSKTRDIPAKTGTFTDVTAPLLPSTKYYAEAYVIGLDGSFISGNVINFTTNAPVIPTLTTTAATNILSTKATSGGTNIDSGGASIIKKGVCWSTSSGPTIALSTQTNNGGGSADYGSLLTGLTPSTKYYVRAYATNSVGTNYGNEISFTTTAAVPIITVDSLSLNAGNVVVNTSSNVISYQLTGAVLTPNGTITITAPAGFTVSLSSGSGFANSVTYNYTGTSFGPITIYVQFNPTQYGLYSGTITHSGGGASGINLDNVSIQGVGIQNPASYSNSGTDFWLGFGYQEKMNQKAGSTGEAKMSVYVTTGNQAATVHVDLGSGGYTSIFTIPANSFHEFTNFPTGDPSNILNPSGLPDARLYATGKSYKGVHVYSENSVPISVFEHTYTNANSSAGAMIFPTNTWNSNYTVQAYGGRSNNSNPNSFFFVIANDDNTPVTFKPTNDVLDSNSNTIFNDGSTAADVKYKKDTTYTIMLNKGEVFNAIGYVQGTGGSATGLDLSGTTVKTTCDKKIAVFGGYGRGYVNPLGCSANTGSDHLIQQMFPSVAWGTKYLTNPTKTVASNYYRIYLKDITTVVKVNGVILDPSYFTSGIYYEYQSDQPLLIESDKPINVCQFMTTPGCNTIAVNGGPEMIILSPVQQAIKSTLVYSAPFKTNGNNPALADGTIGNCASYINVVIPNAGVSSFQLDGVAVADTGVATVSCSLTGTGSCPSFSATGVLIPMSQAFRPHPQDPNYSIANFWVTTAAPHTLSSTVGFNAIAYGAGIGESYGYNAGTNISDLTQYLTVQNFPYPNTSSDSIVSACLNVPFTFKVTLPYKPVSMKWDFFKNSNLTLSTNDTITFFNPIPIDSFPSNGTELYVYAFPTKHIFTATSISYPVSVTINVTDADGCSSIRTIKFSVKVANPPQADWTTTPLNPCPSDIITFHDATNGLGNPIVAWEWNFASGTPATANKDSANVSFPGTGPYAVHLRAINNVGCYKDTTKNFTIQPLSKPTLTASKNPVCKGTPITFTAVSGATVLKYYWDFGNGKTDSSATNTINYGYTSGGSFNVTVYFKTVTGCISPVSTVLVVNVQRPIPSFLPATFTSVCTNSSVQFINTSNPDGAASFTSAWNFGDAVPTTSTATSPSFTYTSPGTYDVKLLITTSTGCIDSVINKIVVATPSVTIGASKTKACINDPVTFTATTTFSVAKYYWDFGNGKTDSSVANSINYSYTTKGTYNVTVYIRTTTGCISPVSAAVTVTVQKPVADFSFSSPVCSNTAVLFTNNSDADGGTPFTSAWTTVGGSPASSTAASPTITYAAAGSYSVKLEITNSTGCKHDTTKTIVITSALPAPTNVMAIDSTNSSVTFQWNSVPGATGYQVSINGGSWQTPSSGSTATDTTHVAGGFAAGTIVTIQVKALGSLSGCTENIGTASGKTKVPVNVEVFVPTAFTPNGDGKNDRLCVYGNNITSFRFMVFNQWGEKVYETAASNNCWDGMYKGKQQPVGEYAYVLQITQTNGTVVNKKGLVSLLR